MWSDQHLPAHAAFPSAPCPACARDVLVYRDLAPDGAIVQRCLDCDAALDQGAASNAWSTRDVLDAGYALEGATQADPSDAGCASSGGCRGGACSTHA